MATYTTFEQAETAYLASTDYADGNGNISKARALRSSIIALTHLSPTSASQQGAGYSKDSLQSQYDLVNSWLKSKDAGTGDGTTLSDFSDSRRG